MKSVTIAILLLIFIYRPADVYAQGRDIYKIRYAIEVPLTGAFAAASYLGFRGLKNNPPLDTATVLALDPQDVAGWNRITINPFREKYAQITDYIFFGSFAYGFLLFLDDEIRQEWGDITMMYLKALGITGASYALTAWQVDKIRPYSYDPGTGMGKRTGPGARNSFYGGHPSLTATTTFFAAKVYSDYYPDSDFKYAMFGIAGLSTLTHAYLRGKGGYHFTSDLAIGVAWGTLVGWLTPALHKRNGLLGPKASLTPFSHEFRGLSFKYRF